jgi:adenine phosphoribosyltransferase
MANGYVGLIRNIPDFPEPGIIFRDITPLLQDAAAFRGVIKDMSAPFRDQGIDQVVAIEARGYLLGAPMAVELNTGFVPVRKVGKLPFNTIKAEYDLEYGEAVIEMHRDGLEKHHKVLIVDDVLATGGTLNATITLVEQTGATVIGIAVLIELKALGGRAKLGEYPFFSLFTM